MTHLIERLLRPAAPPARDLRAHSRDARLEIHRAAPGSTLRNPSTSFRGSTMKNPRAERVVALVASLFAFAMAAPAVGHAQDAVIKGTVTGPGGQPLEGVQVGVQSMLVGGISDAKGAYSFHVSANNAKGQTVNIVARRLGFSPVTKPLVLSAGEHTVDVALAQDVRRLDEIVLTGVAGATAVRHDACDRPPAGCPCAANRGFDASRPAAAGAGGPKHRTQRSFCRPGAAGAQCQ